MRQGTKIKESLSNNTVAVIAGDEKKRHVLVHIPVTTYPHFLLQL